MDPSVIEALETALAAAPDNDAIRSHLTSLLVQSELWGRALEHCRILLDHRPDDTATLGLAATAAEQLGDHARASAYRRMLDAFGRPAAPPAAPSSAPANGPASDAASTSVPIDMPFEDEFDRFLRESVAADAIERPRITLDDVGGLDEVKRRLTTSFLAPMRNPELRAVYGKSLRGGLLMYGPPGCGKTHLARAVAGELDAKFFAVGLNDVLDMWLGNSEKNVHAIFETARREAPCVLFIDEVDALGLKRANLSHSAGRNVVVQLLAELDGTLGDNEGIFVLGATNQPWDLDPALRRPGRFDRMLLVLPPDAAAREAIIRSNLAGRLVDDVDVRRVAAATERFSGADLRLVCETAAEYAMTDSIESGRVRPISRHDLERAARELAPSTPPWFEIAKNFAMFANEGGVFDDLLAYMRKHRLG